MSNDCWLCLQNWPGHAQQSGNCSSCCSIVTLLALQPVEEENDKECLELQLPYVHVLGDVTGNLAISIRKSAFLKLCCLLHCGTRGCNSVSSSLFLIHMLSKMFLILFIYCRYIMSNLAYWYFLVTVVSTHYLRHSVTNGWCMFCFMTFKYIFIFKTWMREINIFLWLLWL